MKLDDLLARDPYMLSKSEKGRFLTDSLGALTQYHMQRCEPYRHMIEALPLPGIDEMSLEELPFLPVRLFKMHEFRSVPLESVVSVFTSSGSTGQAVSRIYIDRETSFYQKKALVSILKSFVGSKRYPMLMVDTSSIIRQSASLNARGAGLLGLSFMGRDHFYLLDENMDINWMGLGEFLEKHQHERILLFGFTFMIWQFLFKACQKEGKFFSLTDGLLIHSGGWKKLQEEAVDNQTFKETLGCNFNIQQIHNFYGMAEQVGSIFMECEEGYLHAADFSDVFIRDPYTLEVLPFKQPGLVQVMSLLPRSYPGHNLLTEDLGYVLGEDDCPCGRKGKYFAIQGRLPQSELRGCSDTYAYAGRK